MADNHARRPVALVVDDDADTRRLLETLLRQDGFDVVLTADGIDGVAAVQEFRPLVTVLDVGLPGIDGLAAARLIRQSSPTYLIMVTGRATELDVVEGLTAGADDFLAKPLRPREFRARIGAVLRRMSIAASWQTPPQAPAPVPESMTVPQPGPAPQPGAVTPVAAPVVAAPPPPVASPPASPGVLGSLELDAYRPAAWVDGRHVSLLPEEHALLGALLETRSRVQTIASLVLVLRGGGEAADRPVDHADRRRIATLMTGLIHKLGDDGPSPRWVEAVPGVGYRLVDAAPAAVLQGR